MPRWLYIPLVAVLACSRGSSVEQVASDTRAADESAVRAADSALSAAVQAKDADRTAALYADDAVEMPIAEPLISGRAAIREEWAKVYGIPGFTNKSTLESVEVSGGSLAYTRGTYESTMLDPNGAPVTERGKFITVWRRQADGTWRVAADISNTDAPPPLHQESTHSTK